MSNTTEIQWANHTGGPYLGCTKVSPGCMFCYALALALSRLEPIFRKAYKLAGFPDWETRPVWGDKATRVLSRGFWNDARRINAAHGKAGTRGRWFPSMIDWLDEMPAGIIDQDGNTLDPIAVLADFLKLIHATPNLDWLLLTKRPELCKQRIEAALGSLWLRQTNAMENRGGCAWLEKWIDGEPPHNVWIGTSVENQEYADKRIPELLKIPAKIRFLSVEPLLGPVDLFDAGAIAGSPDPDDFSHGTHGRVDWVIVGGESGRGARPTNIEWIRDIVRQCKAASLPCFVKQLGSNRHNNGKSIHSLTPRERGGWKHPKGGDPAEWPEDIRIREFPKV